MIQDDWCSMSKRTRKRYTPEFKVFVGADGKTPAMRLGFAKQPLTYDDILWPGQRIPQRKRRRRKGKVIPGLRRVA